MKFELEELIKVLETIENEHNGVKEYVQIIDEETDSIEEKTFIYHFKIACNDNLLLDGHIEKSNLNNPPYDMKFICDGLSRDGNALLYAKKNDNFWSKHKDTISTKLVVHGITNVIEFIQQNLS